MYVMQVQLLEDCVLISVWLDKLSCCSEVIMLVNILYFQQVLFYK